MFMDAPRVLALLVCVTTVANFADLALVRRGPLWSFPPSSTWQAACLGAVTFLAIAVTLGWLPTRAFAWASLPFLYVQFRSIRVRHMAPQPR